MIFVEVINCNYNGRNNQNTTFWFSKSNYGFNSDTPTDEWIFYNLDILYPSVRKQVDTKIKVSRL